jgi:RimJ/RimL family protein N-acetyltransferase
MNALEVIHTARMHLARMQRSDLADLEEMYADPVVMATLGGVRSKDEVAKYLETHLAHWQEHNYGFWTVRDPFTGQFAGRGGLRSSRYLR